jgi:hypothetical protein
MAALTAMRRVDATDESPRLADAVLAVSLAVAGQLDLR